MIVPAAIYALFNYGGIGANGWGIPMATDIAFAVAILSILGKRIPLSLKIFLTALAIVDDLGAILVIAFFYTQSLAFNYLFYSLIVLIILYLLNISRVKSIMMYVPFGILLWYFIYKSGIHATIAGVLFAFMIPTNKGKNMSPLEQLEHILNKPVSYLIMPLFALSNTDIIFSAESWQALRNPIGIGIVGGLLFGKVIGIVSFAYLSIKLKLSSLPTGTNWKQLIGAGFLGGIGFTMSIFIALLSFPETEMQSISKFAILFASITSGLVGYLILRTGAEVENKDELIEA
jgi:NhaA family Na+:H+ antiporter